MSGAIEYATVSRAIWLDPEFTSLTAAAQHLYFLRKVTKQRTQFNASEVAELLGYSSPAEVERAATALHPTKYGHVLDKATIRGNMPLELRREVFAHDGWACVYCHSKRNIEVDHIYPISKGGTDVRENLQTLCRPCNRRKGARL